MSNPVATYLVGLLAALRRPNAFVAGLLALGFAAGFAACAAIGLGSLACVDCSNPPLTDLRFAAATGPTLSAEHLTAKVAPVVQQHLIDAKPDILSHAGGPVERTAVKLGYPLAVREVPVFVEHGIDAVVEEFGSFSIKDLIEFFDRHAKAKGMQSHLANELKYLQETHDAECAKP